MRAEKLGEFFAYHIRFGFPIAALYMGNRTLEGMTTQEGFTAINAVVELNEFFTTAVKDYVTNVGR